MFKKLLRLCILAALFVPSQALAQNNGFDKDIPYRKDVERCALDVLYNVERKGDPVIVWFHGGGLVKGNKSIPSGLKGKNCVVVAAGYRLYPGVSVAEIIDDAAAAVAWIVKNISKYGGDPGRIVLSGHSAGAYLVSMLALDKKYLAKYDVDPDTFELIAPISGQMLTHFTERESRGIDKARPLIDSLAPLFHIRKDAPPFFIVTGDRNKEMICRYEENALFCALMEHVGHAPVTHYELQGYGHVDMLPSAIQLLVNELKLQQVKN